MTKDYDYSAYVAGSVHDLELVNGVQVALAGEGYRIELDWTAPLFDKLPKATAASMMLRAAQNCDLFVLVAPLERGLGCFVEIGAALASKRGTSPKVVVYHGGVNNNQRRSMFWELPDVYQVWGPMELQIAATEGMPGLVG